MSVHSVVSLPGSGSRYEGMTVDYHPTGALSGYPVWRCVWRSALNSGSGAWAADGPPLVATQGALSTLSTANVTTWTTMGNTPQITVPETGLYRVSACGTIQDNSSSSHDARVRIVYTGVPTQLAVCAIQIAAASHMSFHGGTPFELSLTDGWTLQLQVATSNDSVNFGNIVLWRLAVEPVELRP